MKLFPILLAAIFLTAIYAGTAFSAPPGQELTWDTAMGKVTYSGQKHAEAGNVCDDCHKDNTPFTMKKGTTKMTMSDMNQGKYCGTCHNGEKAFAVTDQAQCTTCHKM